MSRQSDQVLVRRELLATIRRVRNRWRARVALRGFVFLLAVGLAAFFLSSWGMEAARFSPGAVVAFRVITWVILIGVAVWFLLRPLARRLPDAQVALYLEEHEPTLEAAVLSALDVSGNPEDAVNTAHSPALVERLIETAIERAHEVDSGRQIEQGGLYRWSGALVGLGLAGLLIFLMGPGYLRHGASVLLNPTASAEDANPYSISVMPGDVTIARGSDQLFTAQLLGFGSEEVELLTRTGPDGEFEPVSMVPGEVPGGYEILLFDIDDVTEYFVRSAGIQSGMFRIEVEDLPYVDRLELVYEFPAYTGLPPRTIENGGDIAVLRGTRIQLRAIPTVPSPGGNLWIDDRISSDLAPDADGSLTGSFVVEEDGFYRIELESPSAGLVPASRQFTIDVLADQPPSVSFTRPGRDTNASPIEEVFVEARADDDYGIGQLDLVFSVNGGEEQTVALFGSRGAPMSEVTAGHTFFLEDYGLVPGDIVSYYATTTDNNGIGGSQDATSDLYFIKLRRFGMDFRQSEQGGGGGGGGGGPQEQELSEQQREVISATFNLNRDRDRYSEDAFEEGLVVVRLSQERLREQVQTLATRLDNRGVTRDPEFEQIAEILPRAIEEMEAASERLEASDPAGAMAEEQQALQHLLRAEALYDEVQVAQQGGGGGGGGGGGPSAEDLADLFELELDKLKNQYESVERGQREQADQQIDETLERLKELARRQEQEAERQRRLASRSQGAAGGGSQNQRSLAEDVEEEARRLERLSREQSNPRLMETARQLQDAADAMREAAAGRGNEGTADARAALERLRDARRLLERDQSGRLQRTAEDALERAEQLVNEQQEIAQESEALSRSDERQAERTRRLIERKDEMNQEVTDLERQIDRAAADARSEQRAASDRLAEAAESIRDNKLKERIQYSRGLPDARSPEFTRDFERQITDQLGELRDQLEGALDAIGESTEDQTAESLDRTRDLVRGMESLDRRLQDRADENGRRALAERNGAEAGQQGQQQGEGQQGQGQQGEGQQGQGQQGQGQQGQGQGQQGQQGQGGAQGGGGPGEGAREGARGGGGQFGPGGDGQVPLRGLTPGDVRQFRNEYQERAGEMADLRRELNDVGADLSELDDVIQAMRQLDDRRVYDDMEEIIRLQTQIMEGLKRFEYGLRRSVAEDDQDRLFLSGADEVPPGFRELIEEYYRSLSRGPGG